MSRINDALKKARQAHAATPSTAAGPALRPLRNPSGPPRRVIFTRPVVLLSGILLIVVACTIWFGFGGHGLVVRANSNPTIADSSPETAPEASVPPPETAVSKAEPAPVADATTAPIEIPAPAAPVSVVTTEPATATDTPVNPPPPVTDAPPAVEIPSSEPTLILQGLLFRPGSPVAIINGQTVSVGSHVGDARVVAMDQHSATVVTAAGRTNVLEMTGY